MDSGNKNHYGFICAFQLSVHVTTRSEVGSRLPCTPSFLPLPAPPRSPSLPIPSPPCALPNIDESSYLTEGFTARKTRVLQYTKYCFPSAHHSHDSFSKLFSNTYNTSVCLFFPAVLLLTYVPGCLPLFLPHGQPSALPPPSHTSQALGLLVFLSRAMQLRHSIAIPSRKHAEEVFVLIKYHNFRTVRGTRP